MSTIVAGKQKDPSSTTGGTHDAEDCDEQATGMVDSFTRSALGGTALSSLGRGALSGWTLCPLCGDISKKKYSLGRGIANHLQYVHTPWTPSKLAQKIHKRKHEADERRKNRSRKRRRVEDDTAHLGCGVKFTNSEDVSFRPLPSWEPTEEEKVAWKAKMIHVLHQVEQDFFTVHSTIQLAATNSTDADPPRSRNGKLASSYRESLPPFLIAASKGELSTLRDFIQKAQQQQNNGAPDQSLTRVESVQFLLDLKDRHNATAEHWAAGGGHLTCLRYLYELRAAMMDSTRNHASIDSHTEGESEGQGGRDASVSTVNIRTRLVRRRDGKTCLHYAARNGHVDCIKYLLTELPERQRHSVDERSGEGTTPLHLACYGGHPKAVKYLIESHGGDVHATNDWGCSCAHWVAMTISKSEADVRELCNYLKWKCGVSFVERQQQGHSPLHKAAQRTNRHVIQWLADPVSPDMNSPCKDCHHDANSWVSGAGLSLVDMEQAGAPDNGGHRPSDIWKNMGGAVDFSHWMKTKMQW